VVSAHAASMMKNGSIGSRKRGVSTLIGTIEIHHRIGIAHIHQGALRARRVNAPASASRQSA
jgi:hypothetical protein